MMNKRSNHPLVSVLMTAYNREKYIAAAIESVTASTYQNWELIISDDQSSDKTVEIGRKYERQDQRIKVFVNEENLGDYPNRNKTASYANGTYLKYLDSDDIIMPWTLEIMIRSMEDYPEVALGITSNLLVNTRFPKVFSSRTIFRLYYSKNFLLCVGPSGVIIRRSVFERFGGFSGKQYVGDFELWLKMANQNSIMSLPANLVYWRVHEGQQISSERDSDTIDLVKYEVNKEILSDKNCPLLNYESQLLLHNFKMIKCKQAIIAIARLKFRSAHRTIVNYNLKLVDFLSAIRKNTTLDMSDLTDHSF